MTEPSQVQAPPKLVLAGAVLTLLLAGWLLTRSYTSAAARECSALYRAARTAADSARVDTTTSTQSHRSEPRQCGHMRSNARWQ